MDRVLMGDFHGPPTANIAAFLQTWLFFGLMHEILAVEIRTGDFIRIDISGKKWLTTKKLPNYLQHSDDRLRTTNPFRIVSKSRRIAMIRFTNAFFYLALYGKVSGSWRITTLSQIPSHQKLALESKSLQLLCKSVQLKYVE